MFQWLGKVFGGLFGGGKATDKVLEIADEAVNTTQERSEQDSADTKEARITPLAPSHGTWFDALVDGMNRLPRPAFATWAFGELVGWWSVKTENISGEKMQLIILIITFYFAGRALLKDLPGIIMSFRGKK